MSVPTERVHGAATGFVFMRNFDAGVFGTLGAALAGENYTVAIDNVAIPVIWANPEQVFEDYIIPSMVVRRDDIYIATERFINTIEPYRIAPEPVIDSTELIQDGDFALPSSSSGWVIDSGWTLDEGNERMQGTESVVGSFYQNAIINTVGAKRYRVSFDIGGNTSTDGKVWIHTSDIAQDNYYKSDNGSTFIDIQCSAAESNGRLYFNKNAEFNGWIDNVSVNEITDGAMTMMAQVIQNDIVYDIIGHDRYQTQEPATPFNFTYNINMYSKYRSQLNNMLRYVMNAFRPRFVLSVADSLGEIRTYNGNLESTAMLDEVITVTDRIVGFGVTLKVEGELDFHENVDVVGGVVDTLVQNQANEHI